ncbi:MAG TPA: tetratricopeptide repeat protein [Thermoanaerobaculia bacterium]|nr:tetratricopeptide repeat protein [Thermoanaerobaculia bacterium]
MTEEREVCVGTVGSVTRKKRQGPANPPAAATAAAAVEEHPTPEVIHQFTEGRLTSRDMRRVLRHLLGRCPLCQEAARQSWNFSVEPGDGDWRQGMAPAPAREAVDDAPTADSLGGAGRETLAMAVAAASSARRDAPDDPAGSRIDEAAYDQVLDRVFSRVAAKEATVADERARGLELFEELMEHPPAHQQLLVRNSARFGDRMLCENLINACHEQGFREPARAIELGRLAVAVASMLGGDPRDGDPGGEQLQNLKARAWAQLGNAQRINHDLVGAERGFAAAEELLGEGGRAGLLDRARVFDLKASLRKDQRQFAEACHLLDRVIVIYRKLGQWNLLGRALNQKATVLNEAGDAQQAMSLLRRALDLLDPHEDPRLFLTVRHNLIFTLNVCGRSREAFALLFHTRPLYLKMGDRMNLLRLRWLEGCVSQGLGRLDQAEAAFREVRDAYFELQLDYDAALVALDLAGVYAQQGRTVELRRLAEEMLAIFESRQFHVDAMAALLVFCNAARIEKASAGLVQDVAAFLKSARNNPGLRFTPAS